MKKHIFSLFVLLALVLPMLGMEAAAEIVDSGTCGENLTWVLDSEGALTISGTGDMDSFGVASEAPWANQRESVNTVVIEMGVTSISDFAFNAYSNLTSVTIPEGLTSIGYIAFSHCNNLTNINIPEGVTNIGTGVFNGCSSLTGMTIPKSVTSIGDHAFNACSSLACVTISEEVASIGSFAFGSCSSLTGIYVDEKNPNYSSDEYGVLFNKDKTVLIQAPGALEGSYSVPQSVTSIEEQAFSGCSSLISVTIPESVASIGSYTFSNCSSLSEISVDAQNPNYSSDECGVLFNGDKTVLIQAPGALEGSYSVPQSVTSIEEQAFSGCSSLISVTIPEGVSSITYAAFRDCSSLISVTIPEDVTSIGSSVFKNCSSLTSITIPEGVTRIGDWAFNNCNSLTSITIPDGVTSISDYAFSECSSLISVAIPESVTSIDSAAFSNCTNLNSITIPEGVTNIGNGAFFGCESLSSITIPDSITSIGDSAFYGCENLSKVEIADTTAWCRINFENCDSNPLYYADNGLYLNGEPITEVVFPEGITSIPDCAFCNCKKLHSITIPEGVTSIGYSAFYDCESLSSITIPESVTSIDGWAFHECDSLTGIWVNDGNPNYSSDDRGILFNKNKTQLIRAPGGISGAYSVPESVTDIGMYAFRDCRSLTSITIPEGLASVGYMAFGGCDSLTGIWANDGNLNYSSDDDGVLFDKNKTQLLQAPLAIAGAYSVPESVTDIGMYAFRDCRSLISITIPDSVTVIWHGAFGGCESLSSITMPEEVTVIYGGAFSDCTSLSTVHYAGTAAQSADISIFYENEYLTDATWHYECNGVDCMNPPPIEPEVTEPEATEPKEDESTGNPFVDVFEPDYYYNPVLWTVKENITNGMDATHFAPGDTCTRGQIVTFLWRTKGSPEPKTGYNPFRDVKMTDYFYKAVLWAVENGITSGMGDGSFAPGAPCTRGQVATFLWRACGQTVPSGTNIFTDIAPGAYYYDAVLWAVENGITNGMGDGTFAPDAPCTRGQIVTFLYRAMA